MGAEDDKTSVVISDSYSRAKSMHDSTTIRHLAS
jgi:hypothetical protein